VRQEELRVRDAQQILGVSRTMVLKLSDAGRLRPAIRLPDGTRIFRRADVERLAAERRKTSGAQGAAPEGKRGVPPLRATTRP
jgi:predicted site-specific integrase-resolvase